MSEPAVTYQLPTTATTVKEPAKKKPQPYVCRWRRAITTSGLASTTRHVLLTLSVWMDGEGGSCHPSTSTIADAAGLSERSVCTHLDKAARAGWIRKVDAGRSGKGWKLNGYVARTPKALKEVQYEGAEGTEPHAEGTEPHDTKALNEVQSKSTKNSTDKERGARARTGPTLEEVKARGALAMIPADVAERFFYHYEGQEWLTGGGTPITNWQAKLMKWKLDEKRFARGGSPSTNSPAGPASAVNRFGKPTDLSAPVLRADLPAVLKSTGLAASDFHDHGTNGRGEPQVRLSLAKRQELGVTA